MQCMGGWVDMLGGGGAGGGVQVDGLGGWIGGVWVIINLIEVIINLIDSSNL